MLHFRRGMGIRLGMGRAGRLGIEGVLEGEWSNGGVGDGVGCYTYFDS